MKITSKILAAALAAPLLLGSFSSLADVHIARGDHHKASPHVRMMNHLFKDVELTQEQKVQIKANMDAARKKPANLALKEKPSKEAHLSALLEGVNLTQAQKDQVRANMDARPKRPHGHPTTFPELAEQHPVGHIR